MEFPRRGEIYFIGFPATGAGEMAGPHPALVVQNDVAGQERCEEAGAALGLAAYWPPLPVSLFG